VLGVGDTAPLDARVWTTPRESVTLGELFAESGPVLLLTYLFDWSSV
jgi:hypothetical protein